VTGYGPFSTEEWIAHFPFSKEAREFLEQQGFSISTFFEFENKVVERALERVRDAVEQGHVLSPSLESGFKYDFEVETLSYPVAIYLVASLGNRWLIERYASAESKRVFACLQLKRYPAEAVLQLARGGLEWKWVTYDSVLKAFKVPVIKYVKYAVRIGGPAWKLVNQRVEEGVVLLSYEKFLRFISEGVRLRILERCSQPAPQLETDVYKKSIEYIRNLLSQTMRPIAPMPKSVDPGAFPPCIQQLLRSIEEGRHLPHAARFFLASFLLRVGVKPDRVVEIFSRLPDFNRKRTEYYVRHIAGEKGGKKAYLPYSCERARSYGLCSMSDVCRQLQVQHPLQYYIRYRRAKRRESE